MEVIAMNKERDSLLKEIMACGFSAYDLHLYLDTHPFDSRAMDYFNQNIKCYNMLKADYQKKYGPLIADYETTIPWKWIDSPWPWDKSEGGMNNVGV
jgi:spore coat protein JB